MTDADFPAITTVDEAISAALVEGFMSMDGARLLAREVERLRAVVERLPKTADGVPITPHMELFDLVHGELDVDYLTATTRDSIPETVRYLGSSYSTREAAEAARAGEEAPDA